MNNDLTKFSLNNILIWVTAFCIMEFPMRYFYLNIIGGDNVKSGITLKTLIYIMLLLVTYFMFLLVLLYLIVFITIYLKMKIIYLNFL